MTASIMAFEASALFISEKGKTLLGHFSGESLRFRIYHFQTSIYCEDESRHFRVPLYLPPFLSLDGSPEHWQTFLSYCFCRFLEKKGLQVLPKLSGGGCCECTFDSLKSRKRGIKSRLGLPKDSEDGYIEKKVSFNPKIKASELIRATFGSQTKTTREGNPFPEKCVNPLEYEEKQPEISVIQELRVFSKLTNIREIPHFVGRESELELAKRRFETSKTVTIFGPPGSGKTALATTLALSLASNFEVIWKCTADTETNLSGSLKELAKRLNLGDEFYLFLKYLNSHQVLLLLDNLDSKLPDAFYGLMEGNTRVIITSKNPVQTYSININGLDPESALRFVVLRTNRSAEREDIEMVCRELGFMPLALRNASALLNFSPNERVHHLFQWLKGDSKEITFKIMQLLQKCIRKVTSEAGKRLLMLTLDLSPDVIPAELYTYFFSEANEVLEKAKEEVRVLSLIEEDEDHNLSVHSLVQNAIRSCYPDQVLPVKVQALLRFFTCETRSELSLHLAKSVEKVIAAIKDKYLPEPAEFSLCTRFIYFCMEELDTVQVLSVLCQMCCVWWERKPTLTEENVGDLEYLAICCKELHCFRKAEKYMTLVIDFRKRGGDKGKLAISYRNLAAIYRKQGKTAESDQFLLKAKRID